MDKERIKLIAKRDFQEIRHKYSFDNLYYDTVIDYAEPLDVLILKVVVENGIYKILGVKILNEGTEEEFIKLLKGTTFDETESLCKYCKHPIKIRNPTGNCDHLYYPENANMFYPFPKEPSLSEKERLKEFEEELEDPINFTLKRRDKFWKQKIQDAQKELKGEIKKRGLSTYVGGSYELDDETREFGKWVDKLFKKHFDKLVD